MSWKRVYVSDLLQFLWILELKLSCKNYMCYEKPQNIFIIRVKSWSKKYTFIYDD